MITSILEWINENGEALMGAAAVILGLIGMAVRSGLIQKKRADVLTEKIEKFRGAFSVAMEISKDKKLTPNEIIELANEILKGSIKDAEAPLSVKSAISDGAAKVDPDPKKKPRPVLKFLMGLVSARLGIPRQ